MQAEHALKEREEPLNNVRTVGTKMMTQYKERCDAYERMYESVSTTVSRKFSEYMQKRQHNVRGCFAGVESGDADNVCP